MFSGCRKRALHALFSLINNPQNNFRVFCDAQLIYGDQYYGQSGNIEHLQNVLCSFLDKESKILNNDHNAMLHDNYINNCTTNNRSNKQNNCTKKCTNNSTNIFSSNTAVLTTFCTLLLNSLYDEKISQKASELNWHCDKFSIKDELEKAKSKKHCTKPRFIRTFMQMFDLNTAYVPTPTPLPTGLIKNNDINNNQVNGIFNGDLVNRNVTFVLSNGDRESDNNQVNNNDLTTITETCKFHRSSCCSLSICFFFV